METRKAQIAGYRRMRSASSASIASHLPGFARMGISEETAMAHHKKRRPSNRRAGCKMCKPWKVNGAKRRCEHISISRAREEARDQEQFV